MFYLIKSWFFSNRLKNILPSPLCFLLRKLFKCTGFMFSKKKKFSLYMLISRCYCFLFCLFSSSSLMMILNFFFTFEIKNECIWWWSQVVRLVFRNLIQQYYQWKYFVCFTSNEMCIFIWYTHTHIRILAQYGFACFVLFFCCVNANFTIDQKMNESLRQVIIGLPLCVCMMCKCVRIRFPRVKMFPYRMKCRVKKKSEEEIYFE